MISISIDSIVFSNQQGLSPVGTGALWFIATPPTNWLICNGQMLDIVVHPEYTVLKNLIGYTYGGSGNQFMLPNLTQKFPLGAGTNAVGATGGTFSVPIALANLPAHTHTITQVAHAHTATQLAHTHTDAGHSHGVTDPTHFHTTANTALASGINVQPGSGWNLANPTTTDSKATGITINTGAANIQPAGGDAPIVNPTTPPGPTATGPVGSGTPLNVVPPWIAIYFIIRYK